MKRKLPALIAPIVMAISGTTHADSGPGCGIGQQVFAGQTGLGAHVLAYTFQRNVFVASNFDNIAKDIAQGGGDHLQSLAVMLDIEATDTEKFYKLAQANFDSLFGELGANDYKAWLNNLDTTLSTDPFLSKYSQRVRGS